MLTAAAHVPLRCRSRAHSRAIALAFGWLVSWCAAFGAHPEATAPATRGDYRIARHDLISFQIYEEPDTQLVQRVSTTGELPLPMIGVVKIAGLTLREAEEAIRRRYIEEDYFISPQVILVVEQYNPRNVSVLGQVNRPSQITMPLEAATMNIVEAITYAGGLTRLARADVVQVTRVDENDREQRFSVNVEAYLAGGRNAGSAQGFQLLPGDIVFVPERSF